MILEDDPGRRPQTLGGMVYLVVVAMAVVGLAIVALGAWRTGISWLGGGLVVGAIARLLLPEQRSGMLRVRRKAVDLVMLAACGTTMIVLAAVIPNQPG